MNESLKINRYRSEQLKNNASVIACVFFSWCLQSCKDDFKENPNIVKSMDDPENLDKNSVDKPANSTPESLMALAEIDYDSSFMTENRVSLKVTAKGAKEMYITDVEGCNAGGKWVAFKSPLFWDLPQGINTKKIFVKVRNPMTHLDSKCLELSVVRSEEATSLAPIRINNDAEATNTVEVHLELSAVNKNQVYITNSPNCQSGGVWQPLGTSQTFKFPWKLGQTNSLASVYAKFRSEKGEETACVSDSIIHDDKPPTEATITINQGATQVTSTSVTVRVLAKEASAYYVTNSPDCSKGGSWQNFTSSSGLFSAATIPWTLAQSVGEATVYAKFRDKLLNESGCISTKVTHLSTSLSLPSVTINNDAKSASTPDVSLQLSAQGMSEVYISNTPDCGNQGTWIQLGTNSQLLIPWKLGQSIGQTRVYAKFRNGAGQETPCMSDSIIIPPNKPLGIKAVKEPQKMNFKVKENLPVGSLGALILSVQDSSQEFFRPQDGLVYQSSTPLSGLSFVYSGADDFTEADLTNGVERTYLIFAYDQAFHYSEPYKLKATPGHFWVEIDGGNGHTCGRTSQNLVFCWGSEIQLGQGTSDSSLVPVQIAAPPSHQENTWTMFKTGLEHSCGVSTSGSGYCWGKSQYGRLGDGSLSSPDALEPRLVTSPAGFSGKWRHLAAGSYTTCGVDENYKAFCAGFWGSRLLGNTANGSQSSGIFLPVDTPSSGFSGKWLEIYSGSTHACGIDDNGGGYCWGSSYSGVFGNSSWYSVSYIPIPVNQPIGLSGKWSKIYPGNNFTCGLDEDGNAYCWGDGGYGTLGISNGNNYNASYYSYTPLPVLSGAQFKSLSISGAANHACGVVIPKNQLYCWGNNQNSQAGFPAVSPFIVYAPSLVSLPGQAHSVGIGQNHSCAVTTEGDAYCWGNNDFGQLGNNSVVGTNIPQKVWEPVTP